MASVPGAIRFAEVNATPPAPPAGYARLYVKTDNVLYLQDSTGLEVALGSASAITQLTGDVTATGPGVTASTVVFVGGQSAADVASATLLALAATALNNASTIVRRDASGNFAASLITANLSGNATTANTSINFTGSLAGDVTGTQGATVVALVGGSTAANVHAAELLANGSTPTNTSSTIVRRDASGNFAASVITANLVGNATTSTSFTGALLGDVTGTQGATVVSSVGGSAAADVHTAELLANASTSANTASAIVRRDASGNFSASIITAALIGNVTGNVSGTAANITGLLAIINGGTNSAAALANNRIMVSTTGSIVEAPAITAARALISNGSGIPTHSVTTATELSYVNGVTSSIQAQFNSITGAAITSLTGDVSATGPGAAAAVVNAVGGSSAANIHAAELLANAATASNTFGAIVRRDGTGSFAAQNGTFTGTISASNFSGSSSGSNTGDVTLTNTNSISLAFSAGQTGLNATLNLSAAGPDAGYIPLAVSIKTDGLFAELLAGTPVQIGTTNSAGAAASAARSDHVHAITSGVVLALLLTGYTTGTNTPITATNSILTALQNLQAQITATTGAAITSLTGDVTATGPGAAAATIPVGTVTDTKAALAVKPAVTVVATTNQTLSGTPTIDGQATTAGTSIALLTAQTTTSDNGPWVVQSGAWTRPTWYPTGGTTQAFQFITTFVRLGTIYGGSVWRQTASGAITIGTTATTWAVTATSGNYKSVFTVGPQSGSAEVDLNFANAFTGTLAWNPTSTFKLLLPPSVPLAGQYLGAADGVGTLQWTNPLVNIDGGAPDSNYVASQLINGGTP